VHHINSFTYSKHGLNIHILFFSNYYFYVPTSSVSTEYCDINVTGFAFAVCIALKLMKTGLNMLPPQEMFKKKNQIIQCLYVFALASCAS